MGKASLLKSDNPVLIAKQALAAIAFLLVFRLADHPLHTHTHIKTHTHAHSHTHTHTHTNESTHVNALIVNCSEKCGNEHAETSAHTQIEKHTNVLTH